MSAYSLAACNLLGSTPTWGIEAQQTIRDIGSLIGQGIGTTLLGLSLGHCLKPLQSSTILLPFVLNEALESFKERDFTVTDLTYRNSTWIPHASSLATLTSLWNIKV